MILTLNECDRSGDYEESVIGFVTYRDRPDAVQATVDIYKNIARRKKKRMELAETEANNWKIKRDSLRYGRKKTRSGSRKATRVKDEDEDELYVEEDDSSKDDDSSNNDSSNSSDSDNSIGEEEINAMEELTEPMTVDVSGEPSLEAIAQLTDQMLDEVDIRDGSE